METRTARQKLKIAGAPYWQKIGPDLYVGYRKGARSRTWLARRYHRDAAKPYTVEAIGEADDQTDADGLTVLTYFQAQDRARARASELTEVARVQSLGPAITVRGAIEDYVAAREKREALTRGHSGEPSGASRGLKRDARSRLTKHVLGTTALADRQLAALTGEELARWRDRLALPHSSAQRLVNDFKAALNIAARRGKAQLPATIRDTIRDGLSTTRATPAVARDMQVLPDADVRAVIAAAWKVDAEDDWDGDLARVILALAATGSRFSQIIRMTVADVQTNRLMVPASRKGRGEKTITHTAVRVGDDVMGALAEATAGRKGNEQLFLRPRYEQVSVAKWERRGRVPWYAAAELTRPWRAIVRRAGLPPTLVPYSLRHSSIVRGLRAGLPVRLVAALHDTSSAMIERHYAAFVIDALDELAARAVVPLAPAARTSTKE